MKKVLILLVSIFSCILLSCTKESAGYGDKTYYGSFSAELLALPGATTLDVYVGGEKIDTLAAGRIIGNDIPKRLTAGEAATISFKKVGTDSLVLDTTITVGAAEKVALQIAYSEALGIQSFTRGSDANVAADSCSFFIFNGVPDELLPDSVKVDGYLFRSNDVGQWEETGITWPNLEKEKLHPTMATVKTADQNGTPITYVIKLKNIATGEFVKDAFGLETLSINLEAGQRQIITLTAYLTRNRLKFTTTHAIY